MLAVSRGRVEVVKALLRAGADVHIKDNVSNAFVANHSLEPF